MTRGCFVTVDGLDGTGKSTLVRNLARALGAEVWATPGAAMEPHRRAVLEALGDHQTARALFYAATVAAEGQRAVEAARQGRRVVMDRYWLSTLAYARARGCGADLEALQGELARPDASLVVTLDEPVRQERMRTRGALTEADAETLSPAFRDTVLAHFGDSNARAFAPLVWVDVTGLDPDGCVEAARRALGEVLP